MEKRVEVTIWFAVDTYGDGMAQIAELQRLINEDVVLKDTYSPCIVSATVNGKTTDEAKDYP